MSHIISELFSNCIIREFTSFKLFSWQLLIMVGSMTDLSPPERICAPGLLHKHCKLLLRLWCLQMENKGSNCFNHEAKSSVPPLQHRIQHVITTDMYVPPFGQMWKTQVTKLVLMMNWYLCFKQVQAWPQKHTDIIQEIKMLTFLYLNNAHK